jgi:hypothetical protein
MLNLGIFGPFPPPGLLKLLLCSIVIVYFYFVYALFSLLMRWFSASSSLNAALDASVESAVMFGILGN